MSHKRRHGGGGSTGSPMIRQFGYQEKRAKPVPPLKLTFPQRQERTYELRWISGIANMIVGYWTLIYADTASNDEWVAVLHGIFSSAPRSYKRNLMREWDEVDEDEMDEGGDILVPTILWAVTRWFCSLDIPRVQSELWGGPPLFRRIKTEPAKPHHQQTA